MRKYDVILSDLEQKLIGGCFQSSPKLPSLREAAELYGCSISTVLRAYTELEKRHMVYSIPQSGYYAIDKSGAPRHRGPEQEIIDFASASPDLEVFPYLDFQHCLNKAIDIYKYELFTYGDTRGLPALRQTLVAHLADSQVFTRAERINVTSGVQQALEILTKMPFPNGKSVVLVEQPSYNNYLRYLEMEGIPVRGISRTAAGVDLQALEECFRKGDIKFFYTMSRHHNPLGTSYSVQERKAIAALAGRYDVYIVEDDYMADLGTDRQFDPIYAYDPSSHTVYLKSFSKIIFPGLRLGAAVLPEPLLANFHAYKQYADTSYLSQAALEVYIKNGMYERHKHKILGLYAERVHAFQQAVERHNNEGLINTAQVHSGVYIQLKTARTLNLERLIQRLAARKIRVVSGKGFYLSEFLLREKFLRISISRARTEQIDDGVRGIVEEVKRASAAL